MFLPIIANWKCYLGWKCLYARLVSFFSILYFVVDSAEYAAYDMRFFFVFERMSFPFLTMSWFFLNFTSLSKFISSFFFPFKSAGLHQGSTRKQTEWFIDYLAKNSAILKKIRRGLSQYHRHRKRFKFFSVIFVFGYRTRT